MSSYQPGIPTGLVNLDVDYQNIQNNFQQLDTTFGIGHTLFSNNTAQNGYHRNIQMIPNSTTASNPPNNQPVIAPAAIPGYGQLFSAEINDGINIDTALYFLSGGNRLTELTRNFSPSAISNGYTFLPGGIIIQWGINNTAVPSGSNTTFTQNFNIPFPNNCFFVDGSPLVSKATGLPDSQLSINIRKSSLTDLSSFDYQPYTNSSKYIGFLWFAIGN